MALENPFGKSLSPDNPFGKSAASASPAPEAKAPEPSAPKPSALEDSIPAAGSGLAKGAISTLTWPFDLASSASGFAVNKLLKSMGAPEAQGSAPNIPNFLSDWLGFDYQPKTGTGRLVKDGTEFVTSILGGPGGLALKSGKQAIEKGAAKLVTEENAPLLKTARDSNIPVYRSQLSKSAPTKMAGSMMKDVPFSGAGGKIEKQVGAFNDAVSKTIGEKGPVTSAKLGKAYDRLSGNYNKLTGKYDIPLSPELKTSLLELRDKAGIELGGDPEKLAAFNRYWDMIHENMIYDDAALTTGKILGKNYQSIRSGIGRTLRSQNGSPEIGQLQSIIDGAFQAGMNPEDAKLFDETRKQYRNMIALEKVVKSMPQGESMSPARLQGAVKQVFGDYAYGGDTELEGLARLGTVLKDTFPQSGTAPRNLANDVVKEMTHKGIGAVAGIGGAGIPIALSRWGLTPYLYDDIAQSPYARLAVDKLLSGMK